MRLIMKYFKVQKDCDLSAFTVRTTFVFKPYFRYLKLIILELELNQKSYKY
jgi:hypothetical protein